MAGRCSRSICVSVQSRANVIVSSSQVVLEVLLFGLSVDIPMAGCCLIQNVLRTIGRYVTKLEAREVLVVVKRFSE